MSILIKGMEMPKNCWECPCDYGAFGKCVCGLTEQSTQEFCKNRRDDCPLIEIQPHGRLIDADEAKNKIRPWSPEDETNGCTFDTVKKLMHKLLNDTPTVIEAEDGER